MFEFCRKKFKSILLTQNSIQTIEKQLKINYGDSIQKNIQFNSQGVIDTGRIKKSAQKSVKNRQKGGFISKIESIDQYMIHLFISRKIQFKRNIKH